MVDEQGVHGADAGWIFSHPARNVYTGDLLAVAGGVHIEEADFVVRVLGGEGFVGRRDVDEDFAALAGGEQVAEDVAVGESLAGLFGAESAPVEGGVGNGRYRFQQGHYGTGSWSVYVAAQQCPRLMHTGHVRAPFGDGGVVGDASAANGPVEQALVENGEGEVAVVAVVEGLAG